jgi:hypothetical protein
LRKLNILNNYNDNGLILFEDRKIVCIATGLKQSSKNIKTGDMIQSWILSKNVSPEIAIKTGTDKNICRRL